MARFAGLLLAAFLCLSLDLAADQSDPLTRAHQLYNQHQYDAAIAAAQTARLTPALANPASVVLARAYLERFRQGADVTDLAAAREALTGVDAGKLAPRDRVELLIGLGESLYFDDRFGAASEMFDLALAGTLTESATPRDRVLDWWANAIDRQAQIDPDPDRKSSYRRLLDRMDRESHEHPDSPVAAYWLVAAARGSEEYERAWQAAIAAWVRAPLSGDRAAASLLRADLDRLVTEALIPDRARQLQPHGDTHPLIGTLTAEWNSVKERWK